MDNARFPNLTPTRVPALICLKRYHDEHVLKRLPLQPFSRSLAYGSAVHETLKNALNPVGDVPPQDRHVAALARRAVCQQNYPDADARDADIARCIASTTAYLSQTGYTNETVGVEIFDDLPINNSTLHPLTLGARFDRLMVRPGEPRHLTIVDYKTGAPGYIDLKGACIMLAIASRRFKDYATFSVEYDFLDVTGLASRQVVTLTEAKEAWPVLKTRALRVYNANQFPAEIGDHCAFCPFRPECWPADETDLDDLDDLFD
jgi:hypothetical protein